MRPILLYSDFDKKRYPLYSVAVEEWRGFVFVNLAGEQAQPLVESFHEDSANLDNWPLEDLKVGIPEEYDVFNFQNWVREQLADNSEPG